MRKAAFALVAAAALTMTGCGGETETAPPPGADTAETPDIDVDTGIVAPGEGTEATEEGGADQSSEEAKQE
jgi:hypothetical protein